LIGERGTGKRTIAERIHRASERRAENFQDLCCALLTVKELRSGSHASDTTLYLDEISDLTPDCQEQLLRMLPAGNGASGGLHVICGTSRDLEREVRAGHFREDLYYRLSGICLRIPPLRQRKEDVPPLFSFFLNRYSESFQRPIPPLSEETQQLFRGHSWPGNLVELEAVARAIVAVGDESLAMGGLRSIMMRGENGNGSKTSLKEAARAASREAEKELILKVLNRTRWNRRRAAEELQISYKALLYKLKQIGYEQYGAT
jgi:DNA-binding NtrC family response regulator